MVFRALFALVVVIVLVNGRRPSCDCDDEEDPWCGEGGTYSNFCQLKCAGDDIIGHDTCENIEGCLEDLPDTDEDSDVCAEYGITFDDTQEMKCHKLSLVHKGDCD